MTADLRSLSVATIKERMADTRMPSDPRMAVLPADSPRWPASFLERIANGLTPASVLIPIMDRDSGLSVLLTQRSAELKLHAGQVSFPGGRMEDSDSDIAATALRETHEEIGIAPDQVDIAGFLPPSPTVTGYAVTPVIGVVAPDASITVDHREVEAAFEVPLAFLMDEANQQHSSREFEGVKLAIIEFNYAHRRIWGATAGMLVQLRKILLIQ